MKKHLFLILITGLLLQAGYAQQFEWVENIHCVDNSFEIYPRDITKDTYGNVYVLGEFKRDITNGKDTLPVYTYNRTAVFIAKYNKTGKLLWIKPYGADNYGYAYNIACHNNKLYVSCNLGGTAQLEDINISIGTGKTLFELDTAGHYIQHGMFDDSYLNSPELVDDTIYVAANRSVIKLAEDLSIQSTFTFTTGNNVFIKYVRNVNDTAFLIAGYNITGLEYNGVTYVERNSETPDGAFVALLSTNGTLRWLKHFGPISTSSATPYDIGFDYYPGANQCFLAFAYISTKPPSANFIDIPSATGAATGLISFDLDGNALFAKKFEGGTTIVSLLKLKATENALYIGGESWNSSILYDGELLKSDLNKSFAALYKLNYDGSLSWGNAVEATGGTPNKYIGLAEADNGVIGTLQIVGDSKRVFGCPYPDGTRGAFTCYITDKTPDYRPQLHMRLTQLGQTLYADAQVSKADNFYWDFAGIQKDTNILHTTQSWDDYQSYNVCLYAYNSCKSADTCVSWNYKDMHLVETHYALVATGGDAESESHKMSYSVGQLATNTAKSDVGTIAEGVQQPYVIIPVSIPNAVEVAFKVKVYPNPTSDYIHFEITDERYTSSTAQLYSTAGQLIRYVDLDQERSLYMGDLNPGTYHLRLLTAEGVFESYSIIKN